MLSMLAGAHRVKHCLSAANTIEEMSLRTQCRYNAGYEHPIVEYTGVNQPAPGSIETQVAIVGGGIAGLWLLNLLRKQQIDTLLLEQASLGGVQTMASQGMIHGGLKYTLDATSTTDKLNSAASAIAEMPQRWRDCFAGNGDLDLSGVKLTHPDYYMFAAGTLGKLSSFFASKALQGRIERLPPTHFPPTLQNAGFSGSVYRLNDPVVDVGSLLRVLSEPHQPQLLQATVNGLRFDAAQQIRSLTTASGLEVRARTFIFCAGAGNQFFADQLRAAGHKTAPATQLRPLHQVFVQHEQLAPFYAHCLTGVRSPEPRLTITSHGRNDSFGWYIGGALATGGVKRSMREQIEFCRAELQTVLPWINWSEARYHCLRVDRAEPAQTDGNKPDTAVAASCANALLCWPTKLALVPSLGELVVHELVGGELGREHQSEPSVNPSPVTNAATNHPTPPVAGTPWL